VANADEGIRDAATVIVAREGPDGPAVFMVRRHAGAVFLPDRYVFPGGAVDPADRALAATRLRGSAGDVDPAYVVTAVRETFEEVGLLFADRAVPQAALIDARRALAAGTLDFAGVLTQLDVALDAGRLRYFSRWITPKDELAPRRFDARFFVARVPDDQVAEADAAEVHDGAWYRPVDALRAHERGEIDLIFPTIKHLERIAPYRTVDELLAFAASKSVAAVMPDVGGDRVFSIPRELENAW
jgi:8-oxo-dGTP pyrophosphatase MutT (NUDIX family)